jgi:hypothetical protein
MLPWLPMQGAVFCAGRDGADSGADVQPALADVAAAEGQVLRGLDGGGAAGALNMLSASCPQGQQQQLLLLHTEDLQQPSTLQSVGAPPALQISAQMFDLG